MPFIIVHGLPSYYGVGNALQKLSDKISSAVAEIKELTLSGPAPTSVYFSMDMLDSEDRKILAVIMPFDKPDERPPEVLNRLSESVAEVIKSEFPGRNVSCPIFKMKEGEGYYSN